ncbi:MAG: hypothetical protein HC795_05285 [Coleofasciculaceae cyanobacterium RL_1_1]|nr:hypothetical protein [Coleofasciculaceae cyanobacterium RL_1_1]
MNFLWIHQGKRGPVVRNEKEWVLIYIKAIAEKSLEMNFRDGIKQLGSPTIAWLM